jgi:hypothetical protein
MYVTLIRLGEVCLFINDKNRSGNILGDLFTNSSHPAYMSFENLLTTMYIDGEPFKMEYIIWFPT